LPFVGLPRNAAIWTTSFTDFAPHGGAAYRLSSDGRSLLRAAAGRYYDPSFGAATDGINGAPYNTWQYNGGAFPGSSGQPTTLISYAFDRALRIPSTWQWNVSLERELTRRDAISAAYVGAAGEALLRREAVTDSSAAVKVVRATSHGWSRYHALQAQYQRHLSTGVQASISYGWSHSIDNSSSDSAVFWTPLRAYARGDVGSSDFDVRHSVSAAVSANLPARHSVLLRGWSLDGIVRARSGFPVNVLDNETALGLSFANIFRPDRFAGEPLWLADQGAPGGRRLNPAAFAPHGTSQGDLGRNAIAGLGMWQADLGLRRSVSVREAATVEFRLEAFNVLNHPMFADPVRFLVSPLFGRPPSMLDLMLGSGSPGSGLAPAFQAGGPRSVQIVVRLRF
jgi:hypothetical protein